MNFKSLDILRISNLLPLGLKTAAIVIVAAIAGLLLNLVNPRAIPYFSPKPYDIYVSCPQEETAPGIKKITSRELNELRVAGVVIVDSRPTPEYLEGHIPGAISLPYDPLACPDPKTVEMIKEGERVVVVYGSTSPDEGVALAQGLHHQGVPMVAHLEGGFPAWVKAGMTVKKGDK
ncbi:MAG: rhodanese-like domain-containing protein [Proteobacteria bacterium]|nr:rhodanese-like domain-containing protein [Pseudomonadota bacterium]